MKRACMSGAAVVVGLAGLAQAQVYSNSPGLPIPASGTSGTIQDQITVSGGPTSITSVNVIIDITHTFTGDLDMVLIPPGGTEYIQLCTDVGGLGDNFANTRLTMSASTTIGATGTAAPFAADYLPETTTFTWRTAANIPLPATALADLNAVNGRDSNGTWTLLIDDDAGGDFGTLNRWSLEFNGALDPVVPAFGIASAVAVPAVIYQNGTTQLRVVALPRGTATPQGVSVDATSLGLGTIALADQGSNLWTGTLASSTSIPAGSATLPVTATANEGTPGTANIALEVRAGNGWAEQGDAGSLQSDAQVPTGTGTLEAIAGSFGSNDPDVYVIEICDPSTFSATTVGGSTVDTQLFLFNDQGVGVSMSDDTTSNTQSLITNTFVSASGTYYLAVSRYDIDPVDSANNALWLDTPFNAERAPDGPAAGSSWAGWAGTNTATGTYIVFLTGACFPGGSAPTCNDIDVNNDGSFFDPTDIDAFLSVYSEGPCVPASSTCDDIDFNNDGASFDPCDIDSFLRVYSEGPCTPCGQ